MDDKDQQGVQTTDTAMPTTPLGDGGDKQAPPSVAAVPTPAPVTPTPAPVTPTEEVAPASGEVSASQVADQVMDQKADFGQSSATPAGDTTPQVPTEPPTAK
jgi:hypothetical protein